MTAITIPHHTCPTELDSGETAEHMVINYLHWDVVRKELSAHISLYKSKAHYESGKTPVRPVVGKIRAHGDDFTKLFGHLTMAPILDEIMKYGHGKGYPPLVAAAGGMQGLMAGTTTLSDGSTLAAPAALPLAAPPEATPTSSSPTPQ